MGYKYLFTFQKTGLMIYISHLDLQRLFRRTIKSCGYKIIYSQGFNPHPKMSIAQPLSLGYIGLQEYMEIELDSNIDPDLIKDNINDQLPDGVKITRVKKLSDDIKSISALTVYAEYSIDFSETDILLSDNMINQFLSQEEIYGKRRQKKTKKIIEVPIKDKIRSMTVEDGLLKFVVDCGSNSNLNPEILLKSFLIYFGYDNLDDILEKISITRDRILLKDNIV
ncbi:hypothetical protein HMPREF1635_05380 [Clostridiales bacterium S5-A14a]|nr:hypothetical protein HMPREF1635_05380 [Clostridiales bacterium S5-A14a]